MPASLTALRRPLGPLTSHNAPEEESAGAEEEAPEEEAPEAGEPASEAASDTASEASEESSAEDAPPAPSFGEAAEGEEDVHPRQLLDEEEEADEDIGEADEDLGEAEEAVGEAEEAVGDEAVDDQEEEAVLDQERKKSFVEDEGSQPDTEAHKIV